METEIISGEMNHSFFRHKFFVSPRPSWEVDSARRDVIIYYNPPEEMTEQEKGLGLDGMKEVTLDLNMPRYDVIQSKNDEYLWNKIGIERDIAYKHYEKPIEILYDWRPGCEIYPDNFQTRFASSSDSGWTTSSLQNMQFETSNRPDVRIDILEDDDGLNPHFLYNDHIKLEIERNNIILATIGQAAISLVSSSSSDSPFLKFFAAATGIGFLGSFFANYVMKKPKIARILSKIGAIGAASAVIFALGLYLPKDTKWNLNMVATFAACLISAVVVGTA